MRLALLLVLLLAGCDAGLPPTTWRVADLDHRPARRLRQCLPEPRPPPGPPQPSLSRCFSILIPPFWQVDLLGFNQLGRVVAWMEVNVPQEVFRTLQRGQAVRLDELRGQPVARSRQRVPDGID